MRKKHNNNSNKLSDWTIQKLKDEYKGYHETIYRVGCYGTSDLRMFDSIGNELDKRGIFIELTPTFN